MIHNHEFYIRLFFFLSNEIYEKQLFSFLFFSFLFFQTELWLNSCFVVGVQYMREGRRKNPRKSKNLIFFVQ
jgi:hypothetical protein